ncbi:hypothetical protein DFP72DRAFT_631050 [Ephemerocybe angulata]|uniref:Uncharacterized protein n=1 Tax=Ephemerocybe angulata TaxID=980116 RepID=A0A8H6ICL4_9AGAR|nr:hypothetical protein DFP72DRAFT_631050 [Tulosesus angulatus]
MCLWAFDISIDLLSLPLLRQLSRLSPFQVPIPTTFYSLFSQLMDPSLSDMGISLRLDADFCQGARKIITALVDLIGDMEKRIKVQEELLQHYTAREQDDHGEESSAEEEGEEEEEEEEEEAESDGEFQTVENPGSLEADDDTNSTEDGDGEGDSEEEQGSEDSGSGEFQELESPDSDSCSADDIMFSEGEEMHGSWSSTAEQLNRGPAEREVSKGRGFKDTKGIAIPVLPSFDFQSGSLLEALSVDRSDDSNSELDPPPNDGEEDDSALPESPTSDTSPGADIAFQCHSRRLDSILCVAEARTVPFRPKGRRMRTEAYACSEDFEYYV